MIRVSLIGNGNVGNHLARAFEASEAIELVQIFSRTSQICEKSVNNLDLLTDADVYIIAVSDDSIADVASKLPFQNRLVVHTSGSVPMSALDNRNRRGVFYPLQTFSKQKAVNWREIPICIEAENQEDHSLLEQIAKTLAGKVYSVDSDQRRALHVAAVFASNFTNHLYALANDICSAHRLPFEILQPLIAETADKIKVLPPREAQTGPAVRNDQRTIDAHLELLDENQKKIYQTLTQSIQHGKKL